MCLNTSDSGITSKELEKIALFDCRTLEDTEYSQLLTLLQDHTCERKNQVFSTLIGEAQRIFAHIALTTHIFDDKLHALLSDSDTANERLTGLIETCRA